MRDLDSVIWSTYHPERFSYVEKKALFFNAEATCLAIGGHLTSVHNPSVVAYLSGFAGFSFVSKNEFYLGGIQTIGKDICWTDSSIFNFTARTNLEIVSGCVLGSSTATRNTRLETKQNAHNLRGNHIRAKNLDKSYASSEFREWWLGAILKPERTNGSQFDFDVQLTYQLRYTGCIVLRPHEGWKFIYIRYSNEARFIDAAANFAKLARIHDSDTLPFLSDYLSGGLKMDQSGNLGIDDCDDVAGFIYEKRC
ncbi:hypothetical protein L596_019398 [Steinernema carpocapsae]|uniref:C-type lectin domain-containing protein n=1 Tax=Steinernema carpocapsae TaxID=34508 RepID=A0A4V6XVY9_STECR|nr:hypothetical protein L596_019398 [Steinernema carpocapsae]